MRALFRVAVALLVAIPVFLVLAFVLALETRPNIHELIALL